MIGTFFTNLARNITKNKHLISLYQTSCTMIKNGLATLPSLMETTYTYLIEGIKILLVIILGVSVILLGILWGITSLLLMSCFQLLEDSTHLSSNYSYPKRLVMRLLAYLRPYWDSLNAGIDRWLKR